MNYTLKLTIVTSFYNDRLANFILSEILDGLQKSIYERNIRILTMPSSVFVAAHANNQPKCEHHFFFCHFCRLSDIVSLQINILHHRRRHRLVSLSLSFVDVECAASWHNLQINLPR